MESISIARALTELKMIDKRIKSNTMKADFVAIIDKNTKKIHGNFSKEEFSKKCIGDYQSIIDLIERRKKIKSAIAYSNTITKVMIGGKEYTVTEAIERKNSIVFEKELLRRMTLEYRNLVDEVEYRNTRMEQELNKILTTSLSSENLKKENALSGFAKTYKEDNISELLDPLKIQEKIDKLELNINNFESEVDSALTESNVITKIEI